MARVMGSNLNGGTGFHYFLRDVTSVFIHDWDNFIPVGKDRAAKEFVNYLVRVGADTGKTIL